MLACFQSDYPAECGKTSQKQDKPLKKPVDVDENKKISFMEMAGKIN